MLDTTLKTVLRTYENSVNKTMEKYQRAIATAHNLFILLLLLK